MYEFYHEVSIKKVLLWIIYSFLWIIIALCFFLGVGSCSFYAVIDRTNKYVFYLFWILVYIIVYIALYIQVFKRNRKALMCCILCFSSVLMIVLLFLGTLRIAVNSFSEFSVKDWAEFKNERIFMLDDLVKSTNIIGMDIADVEKILGKPDNYNNNEPVSDKKDIVYWSAAYSIVWGVENNKIVRYTIW